MIRHCIVALVLAITFALPLAESAIQPVWIAHYSAPVPQGTNAMKSMALDSQGNVVIAGSSTGASGDYDYLTLKYSQDGRLLWSERYASLSNGNDQVQAMALDGQGNVYLTGSSVTVKYGSDGTIAWTAPYAGSDLAVDATRQVYVTGFSTTDFSTVKLKANGSNDWVKLTDFNGLKDRSQKIAINGAGNLVVAGSADYQCEPREGICYGSFALVQYTPAGNEIWTNTFLLPPHYLSRELVLAMVLTNQSIYLLLLSSEASFDLWHLSDNGTIDWRQAFVHTTAEGGNAIGVRDRDSVYETGGRFLGFNHVSYVTFKVDSAGSVVWEANYDNNGTPGYHRAKAMALDTLGNIYVTGQSDNSDGEADIATLKYSPDGTQQWVQRYAAEAHGFDDGRAIAVDATGNVYVAGTETLTNGSTGIVLIKYAELTSISLQPDGSALLRFFGTPGQGCRFQASTNLADWEIVGSGTVNANGCVTFQDTNAPTISTRFYRMLSP